MRPIALVARRALSYDGVDYAEGESVTLSPIRALLAMKAARGAFAYAKVQPKPDPAPVKRKRVYRRRTVAAVTETA